MQNIEITYGHIKDEKKEFITALKKSNSLVLFHCKDEGISRIKLIEEKNPYSKNSYSIDHYFEADKIIRGDNCRHIVDISRHIIKKLITPKIDFDFLVYKDAKTNELCKNNGLHADAIYLNVGTFELLFDVSVNLDNSARIINY